MEFHEKLQELRKKRGLTQEELAEALYVSRTAISKWESGRGYPNIESLKALAKFFGVTVDSLLSADEALTIAEEDNKRKETRFRNVIYGLLDLSIAMLLFLPFFAEKADGTVQSASLIALGGVFYVIGQITVWGSLILTIVSLFDYLAKNKHVILEGSI